MCELPIELFESVHSFCDEATRTSLSFTCRELSTLKRASKYDALEAAVVSNSVELIDYFISTNCIFKGTELGLVRDEKTLTFLLKKNCPLTRESLKKIFSLGRIDLVQLILPNLSLHVLEDLFCYSVESRNINLVRILEKKGCVLGTYCLKYAVKTGDVSYVRRIINKLKTKNEDVDISSSIREAVKLGSVELLKLFERTSRKYSSYSIYTVGNTKYMDILSLVVKGEDQNIIFYFFGNTILNNDRGVLTAISCGKLEIAKDFNSRLANRPKTLDVVKAVIESGSSKMFFWLLEEGYDLTTRRPTLNLLYKNVEILRYFYERELTDKPCISTAISKGNLKVVRYLHEELEIPVTPKMISFAISSGSLETLKYVWEKSGKPTIPIILEDYSEVFDWTLDHCQLPNKKSIMDSVILYDYDRKPLLSLHKRGLLDSKTLTSFLPTQMKTDILLWMDRYGYFTIEDKLQISNLFNTTKSISNITDGDIEDSKESTSNSDDYY